MLRLYGYWRSSAAYRLRIALALKGVSYEQISVNLAPAVKAQLDESFKQLNPQMRVPVLETDKGLMIQSMAILEWIEEEWPSPALLPADAYERARCRAFADTVACDVHPLNNQSVLGMLKDEFAASPDQIKRWYGEWILRGFAALEMQAAERQGVFLFGADPGFAEICLVPQIYNARRFDVDLSSFPHLLAVDAVCAELEAFAQAAPEAQPDAA